MADYISGGITFSGIGNGTDFSEIISKLKQVESIPMNRMKLWKSDWNKRYEAFGELISTVRDAKTKLADLNSPQKFLAKLASSSNENILTAKAGADAVDGTHSIDVKRLASNAIWSSNATYTNKTDSINTTGSAQNFTYTYKGKTVSVSIPANTSLESFANMVNQDRNNPGVKVSLIKTAAGYTFQVQGTASGAASDLTIHPNNLNQMGGGLSTWISNDHIADSSAPLVNQGAAVKSHAYTVTLQGGMSQTFTIDGDKPLQDLANDINAWTPDTVSFSGGNMVFTGVEKVEMTPDGGTTKTYAASVTTKVPVASYTTSEVKFSGELTDTLDPNGDAGNAFNFELTMADGTTETISLTGDKTRQDLIDAIEAKGARAKVSGTAANGYTVKIDGVTAITNPDGANVTTRTVENKALTDTLDPLGDASKEYHFTLTLADGTEKLITLTGNKTRQDLINAIKAEGGTVTTSKDSLGNYTLSMAGVSGLTDPDSAGFPAEASVWTAKQAGTATGTVQSGVVPRNLTYSFIISDGSTQTVNITNDKNMSELVDAINAQIAPGTAELVLKDGKEYLQLKNIFKATGRGVVGQVESSSNWSIQRACDALITVDNWPHDITSASNTVDNVLEGVTLTLKDVGRSQISVAADRDSVKENIQTFLDTINEVLKKVQELTKWDAQKQTASSNPNDSNYSPSQWDQEKGSVLTGNYGVQLFNTRIKMLTSGTPSGFTPVIKEKLADGTEIFSGDFVSALAQMGIKTCADEGDPNYGLFMVAPSSSNQQIQAMDQARFDDALQNRLDDVINFFAADDMGTSSSSDFRYYQHIKGITKPGTYKVSYTVGSDGTVSDVFINGTRAKPSDIEDGAYTVENAGGASGISIKIDNLTPGTHTGDVSIKQGKVRQLEDFFADELVYYTPSHTEPTIGEKNGALMILQANYKQIMDNIDKKIEREQVRIANWERTQKLAFSRLETLLGQYERNQQSLSSQLGQLSSE